ncbi:MAG: hypothetical protein ACE5HQ_13420 [Gemmatimonadota bacterium]
MLLYGPANEHDEGAKVAELLESVGGLRRSEGGSAATLIIAFLCL